MSDTERVMRVEIVLGPICDPGQLDATRDASIAYTIGYELRAKASREDKLLELDRLLTRARELTRELAADKAAERIDAIPTPRTKLLSSDEKRWARLGAGERRQSLKQKGRVDQRIVKKWAHDKNVVFEPARNARGSIYMRLNVIETLRNMGMTMSELMNRQWPMDSLERALKFAMGTQGRHRSRQRLENQQEQQAATQESE